MTIEEKAKRYDETLEQLKGLIEVTREDKCAITEEDIIDIFPELKESEDEKIRKELIDAVQGLWDDDALPMPLSVKRKDEWLAWLKKQGEEVDVIEGFDTEFEKQVSHLLASILRKDYEYTEGFVKWVSSNLLGYAKYELGKQDEKKSAWSEDDEKRIKNILSVLDAQVCWDGATMKKMNPYQKEIDWLKFLSFQSKPVLEVVNEPKFKLYDWVVTDNGDVAQIGAVNNGYYTLYNGMDFGMSFANRHWHKWTTNDAKDGDVLQLGNVTAIFKKFIGNKKCYCYCSVWDGKFEIPTQSDSYGCYLATPATKEQRDLLKKAMTDAGYIFDFEKKELKEIATPKSEVDDKIEPRFKVGDWIVTNYSGKIGQVVAVSEDGYGYQLNDGLCFGVSWCDIFHLWCIKDARDGDILASDCSVFIFQKEYIAGKPTAYCGIVDGNFCQGSGGCWTNEQCHPATKEQWDTLRSKMKEAGYEWDSEKKELKEIAAPKSEAGDDEEDDKEADDKAENWKLTLARQRLGK